MVALFICSASNAFSQNTEAEYQKNYNQRIQLERINDVYIPADLQEAMSELDRLTDKGTAEKLSLVIEDTVASKLHFSLGRWMSIHWGLEEGSRLSHYLKQRGLSFPDDMEDLLIRCWHRHIKKMPLNEGDLIERYIDKRKKENEERLRKRGKFLPGKE